MTTRSTPHLMLVAVCIVVLAAIGSACGGSSSSSASSMTTTAASAGGGGTTSASGPITTSGGGGAADSQFCSTAKAWAKNNAKQISALSKAMAGGNMKAFYTTLENDYQKAIAAAPSDIKPDLTVMAASFNKFYVVLKSTNFNVQKAAPKLAGLAASLNSAQVKQAEAHLKAWAKANSCSFNSSGG